MWGVLKNETICRFLSKKIRWLFGLSEKNVYLLKKQVLIILFRGRFSLASDLTRKKRRPRRRELSLAQLVSLARSTRELLPQPLWSCMKIFQTLTNCPKI